MRKEARTCEIDALKKAKAVLSGADFQIDSNHPVIVTIQFITVDGTDPGALNEPGKARAFAYQCSRV